MAIIPIDFSKGLNSAIDYLSCPEGHCLTMSDWEINYNRFEPRGPFRKINSTTMTTPFGVAWSSSSDSEPRLYMADTTAHFWRSNSSYEAGSEPFAFTDIIGGATIPSSQITFATLNGILVFSGGGTNGGTINKITANNVNVAALAGAPTACIVRTVNNMVFAAGGTTQFGNSTGGSTISWSAYGDPTTWPAASSLTFRNNDGDWITGLGEVYGNVLIFKTKSIGLLQTTTVITSGTVTLGPLSTMAYEIGCTGPRAIDNLPDGRCVFMGLDSNIYITDGSSVEQFSDPPPPEPSIRSLLALSTNLGFGPSLMYFPPRHEIHVGIYVNSSVFTYLAYDIQRKYWRRITGVGAFNFFRALNTAITTIPPQDTYIGVVTDAITGNSYDIERAATGSPTDSSGAAVTASMSTSILIPPDFFSSGYAGLVIIYSGNGTLQYQIGFDNSYGSAVTLNNSNVRTVVKIPLKLGTSGLRPATMQLLFSNSGDSKIYKVYLTNQVEA